MMTYTSGMQRQGFERAISVVKQFDPAIGRAFVRTTDVVMRDILASPDENTRWTGGMLNGTGAPVEFSFATFADDLRYTVDVGGPSPETRLARIDSMLDELGSENRQREIIERLGQLQEGASLRWGAWLGVRHGKSGAGTSFKIYAETPPEGSSALSDLIAEHLRFVPALSRPAPSLVLVGMSPGSDRCEFYFELPPPRLELVDLDRLMAHVGLEHRKQELMELMGSFDFRGESRCASALPDAQYGFSYSILPGRRDAVFSIMAFAPDLVGGDGLVRRQFILAARRRNWDVGGYASLTEPVAERFFRSTYHNMISFVVGQAPMAGLQISVSPPPLGLD